VVRDNEELLRNWEALKAGEKRAAGKAVGEEDASLLDGVSSKAPALMEAHQLTTKAARVGFDWRDVDEIFDKLHEEVEELREAIRISKEAGPGSESASESAADSADRRVREEVGDLLFAVTNIARHLDAEPEAALKLTNRKFRRRFRHIERGLRERNRPLGEASIDEMEALWQEAKSGDGQ
jgi:MazG family protein